MQPPRRERLVLFAIALLLALALRSAVAGAAVVSPPVLPQAPDATKPFTSTVSVPTGRTIAKTTISVAGHGSDGTIHVASTTPWSSGAAPFYALIGPLQTANTDGNLIGRGFGADPLFGGAGTGDYTLVQFTSTGAGTLVGCTLGQGTLTVGDGVYPFYKSGPLRRSVSANILAQALASGDVAWVQGRLIISGYVQDAAEGGIDTFTIPGSGTKTLKSRDQLVMNLDPNMYYGFMPTLSGTGAFTLQTWLEQDF